MACVWEEPLVFNYWNCYLCWDLRWIRLFFLVSNLCEAFTWFLNLKAERLDFWSCESRCECVLMLHGYSSELMQMWSVKILSYFFPLERSYIEIPRHPSSRLSVIAPCGGPDSNFASSTFRRVWCGIGLEFTDSGFWKRLPLTCAASS